MRDGVIRVIVPRQVRPRRPGLLAGPALRPARPLPALRGFLPGWSSLLGGIEELPLLREISRSSRAICSASCARRPAITASLSSFSSPSRSTASRSRAFSARSSAASAPPAVPGTPVLHHGRPQYANQYPSPVGTTLCLRVTRESECLPARRFSFLFAWRGFRVRGCSGMECSTPRSAVSRELARRG